VADPAFLSAAGLFVLLGAEFVAMLLIIVYVGAVAVLFLFVVMMLDVDFAELKAEMAKYMPLAGLIGVVLLMQLALAYGTWTFRTGSTRGWATRRRPWMRRTTPRRSA
jgi:NADH-quinone oxidoreductase subunit J